jgi:hypothetical protein
VAAAIAGGAVLAAASTIAWVWRHPTAFPTVPTEVSASNDQWPVGQTIYVGMTYPFHRGEAAVTIHAAEANVVENTADATVSFGMCGLKPNGGAIGSVRTSDILKYCETWESIDGQRLTSDIGSLEQLLMKVTPRQRGNVEIAGATVTYSQDWQDGTQDIGEHLLLRVH